VSDADRPRGLFAWFAGNLVTANLLMLILLVGGWLAASSLRSEAFPEIDPRQISISVAYPGATPEEIEYAITRRVEEAVMGIEGVERVRSTAVENLGSVSLELEDFANAQRVKEDVDNAIGRLADFPPGDAENPEAVVARPSQNVIRLVLSGNLDEQGLRTAAETVRQDVLALERVSNVVLQGARAREISIEVSETTLREHGLSLAQVAAAVNASSLNLSAGTLRTEGADILLRTDAERKTGEAFEDIVVASDASGRRLLLRDIATVVDGFEDADLINTFEGEPAVFLQVVQNGDQDALEVAEAVKTFLATYEPPPGVTIGISQDQTEIVADRLNLLMRNGVIGLLLVFLALAMTLDLKLAFWTTLGIPISFLGGFLIFGNFVTINMASLFALIIVLGIVVDDAIVVGENIFQEQRDGKHGVAAAVAGARGVFAPVTVGVLTTMVAFAPLLFATGQLGQIMFAVPVVVIGVLAISLLEVFLVLPAHLSHEGEWSVGAMRRIKDTISGLLSALRDRIIVPLISTATRFRYLTASIAVAILIVALGSVSSGAVRFILFPAVESDEITVSLQMPEGTPFDITRRTMERVGEAGYRAVGGRDSGLYESLSLTIGGTLSTGQGPGSDGGTSIGANLAQATLTLVPSSRRDLSAEDISRRWRDEVGAVPGVQSLTFSSSLIGGGGDVSLNLSHFDSGALVAAVEEFEAALAGLEGVSEIESSANAGKRQIEFALTPAGDAAGLTVQDLARQVRQAFFGEEVQRIQRGSDELRVYVRFPDEERSSLADLNRFRVRLPNGDAAPLSVVARTRESQSPASIDRVDGQRVITVTADVDEAVTTPNAVNATINDEILTDLQTRYPGLRYSVEGQAREQIEDIGTLLRNLVIAVLLMYVMLASVLRSYGQPLAVMVAIPFGAVGAIGGHVIMGYDLSMISLFGMVALSGVVVNGGVVLIDKFNQMHRNDGLGMRDAIIGAARRRFRPIVLTTLTTFVGLAPMMLETSIQARFMIPMAISLAFGVVFSSFVLTILIPCLLLIGEDLARVFRRLTVSNAPYSPVAGTKRDPA
jgi:multidrug efflux pump subunit AcrB